jgi:L-galactono-1,4-lactone dehydrogenase
VCYSRNSALILNTFPNLKMPPAHEKLASLTRQLATRWFRNTQQQITFKSSRHYSASSGPPPTGYEAFANPVKTHIPSPQEAASISRRNVILAGTLFAAAGYGYYTSLVNKKAELSSTGEDSTLKPPTEQHLLNWSGTHEVNVSKYYQPESVAELETIVKHAHDTGEKLRCVGSGLSPNALAFQERGMVSLALMDKILSIDPKQGTVTVQAGARVQEVADKMRPHGLTLQNYASIREQTIGGFTQVSAHGTGATIPPVDDGVIALKVVTPALGTIELSKERDPELFYMARVGLGCLGVVAEVTMQCVPAYRLEEQTFVTTTAEVKAKHASWLRENKHLRYMWIPSTDAVVVVQCNEEGSAAGKKAAVEAAARRKKENEYTSSSDQVEPMCTLAVSKGVVPADEAASLSATQLRDALLAVAPLDSNWVAAVNKAEAEVWRRSAGTRSGWSDEILGFDCGGQQWVLEVAFPCGTLDSPNLLDLQYMDELQALIKKHDIAAPAPIEQRWTASSASPMSPASSTKGSKHSDKDLQESKNKEIFSWVGIIMYLPEDDLEKRKEVTAAFKQYGSLVEKHLLAKYGAVEHWAKIEVPYLKKGDGSNAVVDVATVKAMKARLAKRYPLEEFNAARKRLDPKNILGNDLVDTLLTLDS